MRKMKIFAALAAFFLSFSVSAAEVPGGVLLEILRAEDSLKFEGIVKRSLSAGDPSVRIRAALAAGRIGDDDAVNPLGRLLDDPSKQVAEMAAFALGEIESVKASEPLLRALGRNGLTSELRARALEAAGKIAAANRKDPHSKALGESIIESLKKESARKGGGNKAVILLGLTAALRARPSGGETVIAKFLDSRDWRIRADAANALARLRANVAAKRLAAIITGDENPVARANAARALGAGKDTQYTGLLVTAAESDPDPRVRVNALRAIGGEGTARFGDRVLARAKRLLGQYVRSGNVRSAELNELYLIAGTIGRIYKGTRDKRAFSFLRKLNKASGGGSREIESAMAQIDPERYWISARSRKAGPDFGWRRTSAIEQGLSSILEVINEKGRGKLSEAIIADQRVLLEPFLRKTGDSRMQMAVPAILRVYAGLRPADLEEMLRAFLRSDDLFVRAAAAAIIGDEKDGERYIDDLKRAFARSVESDREYNDAQLSILSSLVKIGKMRATDSLDLALGHYDFLVRRHANRLIKEHGLEKSFPDSRKRVGTVRAFRKRYVSRLGQRLYGTKDYKRALSRVDGRVRAVVNTEKGRFNILFYPEAAPLTVDNFIRLAKRGYFNGIPIHRVVSNFVVQDGDPRGDGNGGPGWQIRCEINRIPYKRGMVGMALSGKDTGGSQWFITHSPQPHLDGGYTVFGRVDENDMKIVDKLVRGDRILDVKIIE